MASKEEQKKIANCCIGNIICRKCLNNKCRIGWKKIAEGKKFEYCPKFAG